MTLRGRYGLQPLEAYKVWVAMKNHFAGKYDIFKYNGKINLNQSNLNNRKDMHVFAKLAKRKDIKNFLLANLVYGRGDVWVGDIVNNEQSELLYKRYLKTRDSLAYTFSQDLTKLNDDVRENYVVKQGQHPVLLKLLLQDEITIETVVILEDMWKFKPVWDDQIIDTIVWPSYSLKIERFRPFLNYDKKKFLELAIEHFRSV